MKANLTSIKEITTRRGVAWSTQIETIVDGKKVLIPVENKGDGGMTIIRRYTKEHSNAIVLLEKWASSQLPNESFPLETIVDFCDGRENLSIGVQRIISMGA